VGCSSKRGEFHHFTVAIMVSRVSRVRVGVSIRFWVSLVLVIKWG